MNLFHIFLSWGELFMHCVKIIFVEISCPTREFFPSGFHLCWEQRLGSESVPTQLQLDFPGILTNPGAQVWPHTRPQYTVYRNPETFGDRFPSQPETKAHSGFHLFREHNIDYGSLPTQHTSLVQPDPPGVLTHPEWQDHISQEEQAPVRDREAR